MDILTMCRICLVQNVRLYAVANKDLQKTYEKLTNFPFETEDSRPKITCLFCYTKLEQCYQLLTKCQKAEELFDQMTCDDYESDISLVYPGQLEYFGGLTRTPIEHVSILHDWQVDSCADDDELSVEDDSCDSVRSVDLKEEHRGEDKIELELQIVGDHEYIQQEEHLSLGASVTKKPTVDVRRAIPEEQKIPAQKEKPQLAGSQVIPTTQKRTSKLLKKLNKPAKKKKLQKKIQHTTGDKPYKCDICQHSFRIKYLLDSHSLIHTGEKPYKCDICQHNFRLKRSLYSHIRIHTGEKPYKCKQCQRSFRQLTHLKHHVLTHTSEKPYLCDICQRGFTTKSNLQTHYRVHTGEKPHKCDVCQRSFKTRWILKHHLLTHTGEKPYKCEICQRSFSRKANLENHVLIHSDKKQYQCEICAKFFSQASTLNGHLRVHKKDGKGGARGAVLLK